MHAIASGARLPRRRIRGAEERGERCRIERRQTTRALLRLREMILSGEFAPGERMSELRLVKRLGVSRTPLRLALATLEHEGLLQGLKSRGYVVREFTKADISDAIELRGVLEGTAARFAAERGATLERHGGAARDQRHDRGDACIEPTTSRSSGTSISTSASTPGSSRWPEARCSSARSKGSSALPVRRPQCVRDGAGRAARVARHPGDGSPPPSRPDRRDRARPGRPGRQPRPRARAAGAANLEVVLDHPEVLERMPGASLLAHSRARAGAETARSTGPGTTSSSRSAPDAERSSGSDPRGPSDLGTRRAMNASCVAIC